jgi:hypothetical protein
LSQQRVDFWKLYLPVKEKLNPTLGQLLLSIYGNEILGSRYIRISKIAAISQEISWCSRRKS